MYRDSGWCRENCLKKGNILQRLCLISVSELSQHVGCFCFQDDITRFWREEREHSAVYMVYLKKVTYHTLSEVSLVVGACIAVELNH